MTFEEAELAGQLAEAAQDFRRTARAVGDAFAEDPDDLVGIGFSHGYSDAGSSGIGPDIKLPPHLIEALLVWLQETLQRELRDLGVEWIEGGATDG